MPRFLRYFDYENVEITNGGTYFLNVKFLVSLGTYQAGDIADIVSLDLKFCIWQDTRLMDIVYVKH